jgi:dihydropteroate synthase
VEMNSPKIMGILNVTPDSFSDGGQYSDVEQALAQAHDMVRAGAEIIDIGGESTRPGADVVGQVEELNRVMPVIEALAGLDAEISIDTRRPEVAQAAVAAGASIWNDVTALEFDAGSPAMAAKLGCEIVLMHMRGTPETMQKNPYYKNVVAEVIAYLKGRMSVALKAGVKVDNIIFDPGIGFGKRLEDNLDLLQHLDDVHMLGRPILLGASRKSFIGKIDGSSASERLGGSIASALWGASMGVSILRVHDVEETVQALKVWRTIGGRASG